MPNQRGSTLILYAIIGLAVVGTLTGIVASIYGKGKEAGMASVHEAWDKANREAQAAAEALRKVRESEAKKVVAAQQSAERKARDYESKWRAARAALRDVPLAVPSCPAGAHGNAPEGLKPPADGPLMLTWAFSLQYDSAWTGTDGQPVFPDTRGTPDGTTTASPAVSVAQALDNHGENASRCSANSRQLSNLIALIRRLQAGATTP